MSFRSLFFWAHLGAGVLAGALILVMSVTGVALTYERQLIKWSDRANWATPRDGATPMPVDAVIAKFEQATSKRPTTVTVSADAAAPVAMQVERQTFFVNPYSGQLLGEANPTVRKAMADLRAWHRWLAAEGEGRATARAITGWANVLFLFMVLSGIYLWFPRRWTRQALRAVSVPRWSLSGKTRDFNWHNALGIWSAVPLALVVASAVPISFPWGNAFVYRLVGEEPPARLQGQGPGEGAAATRRPTKRLSDGNVDRRANAAESAGAVRPALETFLAKARAQEPDWRSIALRVPASATAPVVLAIDRGDGGQPQLRSTLTMSPTGAVETYETFPDQSAGRRLRSILRFLHTGEVLGVAGQTLAGLVTAASVVLVWTGLALALRRVFSWMRRRGVLPAAAGGPHPA